MNAKKRIGIASASVLLALLVIGCAGDTEFIRPECEPAVRPMVPEIDRGRLWDTLIEGLGLIEGDGLYHDLKTMEDRLIDWALENEAILERVCEPPSG